MNKKGKVDTPNSYAYVGTIFNCGTAGFRAEAYVINKLRNIEEKIPAGTLMKDYGNFYITYYSNGTTISEWRMTAVDNDLYYSTKETSSASDLIPLTYLNWSYAINAKYYIYKKN